MTDTLMALFVMLQVVRLLKDKSVPYQFHVLDGIKYRKMGAP